MKTDLRCTSARSSCLSSMILTFLTFSTSSRWNNGEFFLHLPVAVATGTTGTCHSRAGFRMPGSVRNAVNTSNMEAFLSGVQGFTSGGRRSSVMEETRRRGMLPFPPTTTKTKASQRNISIPVMKNSLGPRDARTTSKIVVRGAGVVLSSFYRLVRGGDSSTQLSQASSSDDGTRWHSITDFFQRKATQTSLTVNDVALFSLSSATVLSYFANVVSGNGNMIALGQDLGATLLCGTLGLIYVKSITSLATKGVLDPKDSRKIIHLGSAPLFMLFWPLFSSTEEARFFAAVIPFVNAYKLYLAGNNDETQKDLANAVSRSGSAKEALGGPFAYCWILLLSIVLFWRDSMVGVMALTTMAGGDGMADLIGRRFGKNNKWPFAPNKSMAGTLAFFVSSFVMSVTLYFWFSHAGALSLPFAGQELLLRVGGICLLTALVELLPLFDDNWTVPLSGAILASLLLR